MQLFFKFLLLTTLTLSVMSFNCISIPDQPSCEELSLWCMWSPNNGCIGDFIPTWDLDFPFCFYVDPKNGTDLNEGSAANPVQTLSAAVEKADSLFGGTIFVINYNFQTEVEFLSWTTLSKRIVVRYDLAYIFD